jgi:hypothetical protein
LGLPQEKALNNHAAPILVYRLGEFHHGVSGVSDLGNLIQDLSGQGQTAWVLQKFTYKKKGAGASCPDRLMQRKRPAIPLFVHTSPTLPPSGSSLCPGHTLEELGLALERVSLQLPEEWPHRYLFGELKPAAGLCVIA